MLRIKLQALLIWQRKNPRHVTQNLAALLFGAHRRAVLARLLLRPEVNANVYPELEFRKKVAAGEPFLERVLADRRIFVR